MREMSLVEKIVVGLVLVVAVVLMMVDVPASAKATADRPAGAVEEEEFLRRGAEPPSLLTELWRPGTQRSQEEASRAVLSTSTESWELELDPSYVHLPDEHGGEVLGELLAGLNGEDDGYFYITSDTLLWQWQWSTSTLTLADDDLDVTDDITIRLGEKDEPLMVEVINADGSVAFVAHCEGGRVKSISFE